LQGVVTLQADPMAGVVALIRVTTKSPSWMASAAPLPVPPPLTLPPLSNAHVFVAAQP